MKNTNKAILVIIGAVLLSGAMYLLAQYGFETFISDAATRLAYQIRDEAASLRRSGNSNRTFEHIPGKWPEGYGFSGHFIRHRSSDFDIISRTVQSLIRRVLR